MVLLIVKVKISSKTRAHIYDRDGYVCLRCNSKSDLTIDHIIPISRGGVNRMGNMQTLCETCNREKSDLIVDYRWIEHMPQSWFNLSMPINELGSEKEEIPVIAEKIMKRTRGILNNVNKQYMKLEQQVCTLEQAKKLKELGVEQKVLYQWKVNDVQTVVIDTPMAMWIERYVPPVGNAFYAAFTVAELGVMLPEEIGHKYNEHSSYYYMQGHSDVPVKSPKLWVIWYEDNDLSPELEVLNMQFAAGDTEAEARAAMLIYLLGNHLTPLKK